jgi:uncharacterized lipoprotein YajG
MKRFTLLAGLLGITLTTGCTTNATRLAIDNYQFTSNQQQAVFDNTHRIATEMWFQATATAMLEQDPQRRLVNLTASAEARQTLQDLQVQWDLARSMQMLTVGQYLLNQQGALDVLLEDISIDLARVGIATKKANDAAGVKSVWDLLPIDVRDSILTTPNN